MYFLTASDNEELEEYASLKKSGIEMFSLKVAKYFQMNMQKFLMDLHQKKKKLYLKEYFFRKNKLKLCWILLLEI